MKMPAYFKLPTKSSQTIIIFVSLIGYLGLLYFGNFLFPDLSDITKKRISQAGLIVIYIATLNAGLALVWKYKARHNIHLANVSIRDSELEIRFLEAQALHLGVDFSKQISEQEKITKEACLQIQAAKSLPSVYDWAGLISIILVAIGTGLCFVGAG